MPAYDLRVGERNEAGLDTNSNSEGHPGSLGACIFAPVKRATLLAFSKG